MGAERGGGTKMNEIYKITTTKDRRLRAEEIDGSVIIREQNRYDAHTSRARFTDYQVMMTREEIHKLAERFPLSQKEDGE